ncbi:MAG: hypothetical protein CL908_19975 [Deltaproteobacteria bacterium]|jgi:hypothetical protein|nr:hypothetical protein [Deltaproteobacteria bacterium]
MKRTGLQSVFSAVLTSGVVFASSLAVPAIAADPAGAKVSNSMGVCTEVTGGPAREEHGMWPDIAIPERDESTQPKFVELAQTSGPARAEYRLWPVIEFDKQVPFMKRTIVELVQTSGPDRAEYRLWFPTTQPATEVAREEEHGSEITTAASHDILDRGRCDGNVPELASPTLTPHPADRLSFKALQLQRLRPRMS